MPIRIKRVYEPPHPEDGFRVLVDQLWPRGMRKETAAIDKWLKILAPSTNLRKWYNHDPDKWEEFRRRYFQEIEKNLEEVIKLADKAKTETVTLIFSSREERLNNAAALKEYMEKMD
jgi:uncharacterized protein YeaO (DUF488 family)